jgi:hypothetical protein
MATYHQYSEIVAAYGYRLPPPPPPQTSRVGLALIYAAVGVALGTFTGTALAVATLPPDASMLTGHLTFARSIQSAELRIHTISNAGQAPVIQNHASAAMASPAPAVLAPAVATANPTLATPDHSASPAAAPVLFLHQAPAVPAHDSLASAAPASAQPDHANLASAVAPTLLIHQPPVFHPHVFNPSTGSYPAPVILDHSVIQASNAGQPQILNFAPIAHPAPAAHTQIVRSTPPAASSTVQLTVAEPSHFIPQPVQKQAVTDNTLALATPIASPLATATQPQSLATPTAAVPPASLSAGLDNGSKPLTFYSEGDATVVSYDASSDTVTTDDGHTFMVGTSVTESHAQTWQDYRANVHYRCDQNGSCSLMRTGVIALNARLM